MTKLLNAVFNLRYAAILAVIAPFSGATLMFVLGSIDTVTAYLIFLGQVEPEVMVDASEAAMIKLVASVDHFLFAMILIIFAFGLYAYLFRRFFRSGAEKPQRKLPSWEQLKSLGVWMRCSSKLSLCSWRSPSLNLC